MKADATRSLKVSMPSSTTEVHAILAANQPLSSEHRTFKRVLFYAVNRTLEATAVCRRCQQPEVVHPLFMVPRYLLGCECPELVHLDDDFCCWPMTYCSRCRKVTHLSFKIIGEVVICEPQFGSQKKPRSYGKRKKANRHGKRPQSVLDPPGSADLTHDNQPFEIVSDFGMGNNFGS